MVTTKEVANGALLVSPPIIDVRAQINSFSDDTEIAVNNLGYRFTVVDDDLASRSMKAWGTATFLCDDYLNLLKLDFARHTSAGHTTSPATRACAYWISLCLPQLDGSVFASDDSITQLATSQIFEGLLSSADDTTAILVLNAGNAHFLVGVATFKSSTFMIYDSAPNLTMSICWDWSSRLIKLLSKIRAVRYPVSNASQWQSVFAEVETQHPMENNCAVFSAWNVLAVILHLRPFDNALARFYV